MAWLNWGYHKLFNYLVLRHSSLVERIKSDGCTLVQEWTASYRILTHKRPHYWYFDIEQNITFNKWKERFYEQTLIQAESMLMLTNSTMSWSMKNSEEKSWGIRDISETTISKMDSPKYPNPKTLFSIWTFQKCLHIWLKSAAEVSNTWTLNCSAQEHSLCTH